MTLDQIWAKYTAEQDRIAKEYHTKRAAYAERWAAHIAGLHSAGDPPPTLVGAIAPMSDYHTSVERGWSTD